MGNSAQPVSQPNLTNTYYDISPRVLRNVISYQFNQTVTSTVTVATANSIPQITQGNEVMSFSYTANSLSSMLEFEVFTNITVTNGCNYWIAIFADYTPDALIVSPGQNNGGILNGYYLWPIYFKHYMPPMTLYPTRYSIRMAPSANTMVVNWFQYGGRTQSRVTVKEWSSLSLTNT